MSNFQITAWHGEGLKQRAQKAAQAATDASIAEAVRTAQSAAPVLTGALRASIQPEPVRAQGDQVTGGFGSGLRYALFVEIGARGKPGVYFLRRGADSAFSNHAERLRRAF